MKTGEVAPAGFVILCPGIIFVAVVLGMEQRVGVVIAEPITYHHCHDVNHFVLL